ncbi:hypothetical protein GLOTRDRAFT_13439, partial [Gloeophyllum trabeum ATCC 11539]
IAQFSLSPEQERAFRIVANHASSPQSEQLNMYLGGMAGMGRPQVIKALMEFFKVRNESHRFIVLAPTGSAAAIVGGSTYHSALGVSDKYAHMNNSSSSKAQIQARLHGIEYIFIDELFMISCHDLYKIFSQLC